MRAGVLAPSVSRLNGGPVFTHDEAFSVQVATVDQAETDRRGGARRLRVSGFTR
jgi:predicted 3-demethylubiquinone-9 3-methyltransferase (glyoxalase superfamily)